MKNVKSKAKNSKQKTNTILSILTLATLCITAVIIGQFVVLDNKTNKTLQNGTIINGLNLSGLSKDEAKVILINNFEEKAQDFELSIVDPDSNQTWTFDTSYFVKSFFFNNRNIQTSIDNLCSLFASIKSRSIYSSYFMCR